MPDERTTISLNPYTVEILHKAAALWPEFATRSELIRKILADWDHLRERNGGRTTRIEKLEEWKGAQEAERLPERMTLVERRLGIGDNHDTDHG